MGQKFVDVAVLRRGCIRIEFKASIRHLNVQVLRKLGLGQLHVSLAHVAKRTNNIGPHFDFHRVLPHAYGPARLSTND